MPITDLESMLAAMDETKTWANLEHTFNDVSKDNLAIVTEFEGYERVGTVALLASLLALPAHQAECLRFELLVALALIHCNGQKTAGIDDATRWHAAIGESHSVHGEDPAEDVFVSLVGNDKGDYRLLEGIWEAAGFYTQCIVDIVADMPDGGIFKAVRRAVQAILRLSDLVCARAQLHRFQAGGDDAPEVLDTGGVDAPTLKSRVTFTARELRLADVAIADLAPFLLEPGQLDTLGGDTPGAGVLEQRPLLRSKDGLVVVLPTALSIALRHMVITFAKRTGELDNLDRALANAYGRTISQTQVFGGKHGVNVHWRLKGDTRIAEVVSNVDVGHPMVLQFVLPSMGLHTDVGFTDVVRLSDEASIHIDQRANTLARELSGQPGFQRGMIVRIGCGWGAGFAGTEPEIDDSRWQFEWMSGADFVRLGSLPEMSPLAFWRIQDAVETISRAGVQIFNINGILNLLGWVRANEGHMVPHNDLPEGRISPDQPLLLTLPTSMLRDVRMAADRAYDRHRVRDHGGRWHRVMRPSAGDYFPTEREMKCYASLDDLDQRKLTGVYEGESQLWVTIEAPNMQDRGMVFELWNMVRTWLGRVGSSIAEAFGNKVAGKSVKVYVAFEDSDDINRFEGKAVPDDVNALWRLERVKEQHAVRVVFADGFVAGFRAADNRAERAVVRALGSAFGTLLRLGDGEAIGREIERIAVPNDTARSFHLMESHEFSDHVRSSLRRPLLTIENVESGAARIELGWRAAAPDAPGRYEGKKAAGAFLNRVVDVLIEELIRELGTLDRPTTLTRLLENCERARTDENHWLRTAAAVLGLHAGEAGVDATIASQMGRFAGASLTSRLVLEMAICACPVEGGIDPSDMTLTRLLARAALLYRIGGLSDAIRVGVLPAEVGISSLGDILFKDDLGHMVVEPMLSKATNERFEANAAGHQKHYAPANRDGAEQEAVIDPVADDEKTKEFLEIWTREMGFAIEDGARFVAATETVGIKRNRAVFTLRRSELAALGPSVGLDEKTTEAILGQFVLATRPRWEEVPAGFKTPDIYPWRFGRRLSVAARPLLQLDSNTDPAVLVAPGLLRTALRYVFSGAHTGGLGRDFFQTEQMRDHWLGNAREGYTFEKEVAGALSNAGWEVRNGVGFPEILGRNPGFDVGDIDVLAWRAGRNEVLIIECKDLSLARNYSEVASQLSDYQGDVVDGRADKLKKHLKRVDLANENLPAFARFASIAEPTLVSWLVFSGVSPVHYAEIPALEGTHVGRVANLLAF